MFSAKTAVSSFNKLYTKFCKLFNLKQTKNVRVKKPFVFFKAKAAKNLFRFKNLYKALYAKQLFNKSSSSIFLKDFFFIKKYFFFTSLKPFVRLNLAKNSQKWTKLIFSILYLYFHTKPESTKPIFFFAHTKTLFQTKKKTLKQQVLKPFFFFNKVSLFLNNTTRPWNGFKLARIRKNFDWAYTTLINPVTLRILPFFSQKYNYFHSLRKNKIYNKSRYARNKQIYRTGVFLCIWLTVLTVIGLYYYFYFITIKFTYVFFFVFLFCFSFCYSFYLTQNEQHWDWFK